jgi:uncharacterized protein (TIGR02246 family)
MKIPMVVLVAALLMAPVAYADYRPQNRDELKISRVLDRVSAAWRAGDRTGWAQEFVEDAYFTVSFELGAKGKEQTAWDHQLIFDNFYEDTEFKLRIRKVLFVKPDVVLVQLNGFVVHTESEYRSAIPTVLLEKVDEQWMIAAFQDTPFVVDEYRAHGDLRRFKIVAAEISHQPD